MNFIDFFKDSDFVFPFQKQQLHHDVFLTKSNIEMLIATQSGSYFAMPSYMQHASAKRQHEFFAGRLLAQSLLWQCYGLHHNITDEKQRLPIWPTGTLGCISHHAETAVVLVSQSALYLGVDIERYIDARQADAMLPLLLQRQEQQNYWRVLQQHLGTSPALTLLFSAKESLYKAIYPHVQHYVDFLEASLIALDLEQQRLGFCLRTELTKQHQLLPCYWIYWQMNEHEVLTWAWQAST